MEIKRISSIDDKKKEYKIKPTKKQQKAFKILTEKNCTEKQALTEAGYTEGTAQKPKNVTKTKGWQQLLNEYLPNEDLVRVHREGLEATNFNKPDFAVRHKYLDTAYKLKGSYVAEKLDISIEDAMIKNIEDRRKI